MEIKDLHTAARENSPEVVKILLEKGADVNYTYKDGWTALDIASYYDSSKMGKILIENGADVNKHNRNGIDIN